MNRQRDHDAAPRVPRDPVLAAAAAELNDNGVTPSARSNIARRAGLSRTTVYDRFGDNSSLLATAYTETSRALGSFLARARREQAGQPMAVIDRFVELVHDDPDREYAVIAELAQLSADQDRAVRASHLQLCAGIAELLEEGVAAGELREVDTMVAAQSIVSLVTWPWLGRRWSPDRTSVDHAALPTTLKSIIRSGYTTCRPDALEVPRRPLPGLSVPASRLFDAESVATAKRDALLARGSWVFNRKGVASSTLDAVAEHYGVSKSVIYNNFGSKEGFVWACYRRAFTLFLTISGDLSATGATPAASLAGAVYRIAHAYQCPDLSPLAPTVGAGAIPPDVRKELEAMSARLAADYLVVMNAGVASGEICAEQLESKVLMIPGLFEWVPRWCERSEAEAPDGVALEVARLWAFGLRNRP